MEPEVTGWLSRPMSVRISRPVLQRGIDDQGGCDESGSQCDAEADCEEPGPVDPNLREGDCDHRELSSLSAVTTLSRVGSRTSPVARPSLRRTTRPACDAATGSWVTMMIVCP